MLALVQGARGCVALHAERGVGRDPRGEDPIGLVEPLARATQEDERAEQRARRVGERAREQRARTERVEERRVGVRVADRPLRERPKGGEPGRERDAEGGRKDALDPEAKAERQLPARARRVVHGARRLERRDHVAEQRDAIGCAEGMTVEQAARAECEDLELPRHGHPRLLPSASMRLRTVLCKSSMSKGFSMCGFVTPSRKACESAPYAPPVTKIMRSACSGARSASCA